MAQNIRIGFEIEKEKEGAVGTVITPKLRLDFPPNKVGRTVFSAKIRCIRTGRRRNDAVQFDRYFARRSHAGYLRLARQCLRCRGACAKEQPKPEKAVRRAPRPCNHGIAFLSGVRPNWDSGRHSGSLDHKFCNVERKQGWGNATTSPESEMQLSM